MLTRALRTWAIVLVLLLAACAAPAAQDPAPEPMPRNPLDRSVVSAPVGSPSNPDRSCKVDADCVVKNVGNCCGYYPSCVNVDARTDPAAVRAQCAKSGMAGVCGFPEISACSCVQGRCQADRRSSAL